MKSIKLLPAFEDNYIFVLTSDYLNTRKALAVDPGDAKPVINFLSTENISLSGIFVTHHHQDHIGGVQELARKYDCPVFDFNYFQNNNITTLKILDFNFDVYKTPGHTLDHIIFFENNEHWLFCGDTLFSMGCGRLFEGTYQQMFDSLTLIKSLPDDTQVFCTHEYTQRNTEFFVKLFPDKKDIQKYLLDVKAKRNKNIFTIPVTLKNEKNLNPFLNAKGVEEFQRLRDLRNKG